MTAVVTSVMLVGLLEVKADGGQRKCSTECVESAQMCAMDTY